MVHFNDDFSLDLGALEDNISWMIDGGLGTGRGFVISPSGTGELLHLTKSEHQLVVKATVRAADGKLPVVAGVASTNLHEAIDLTRTAQDAGAQHVMLAPPFYYRLDDDSFLAWVTAVSEAVPDIALMLYDQPWRAGLATNLNLASHREDGRYSQRCLRCEPERVVDERKPILEVGEPWEVSTAEIRPPETVRPVASMPEWVATPSASAFRARP